MKNTDKFNYDPKDIIKESSNEVDYNRKEYKNQVAKNIEQFSWDQLIKEFWLEKNKIKNNSSTETLALSNENDANKTSNELAKEFEIILWVNNISEDLLEINNKNKLSIASVMESYERYEKNIA